MSATASIQMRVRDDWSPTQEQLEDLAPKTGVARLIEWTAEPWPVDGGVPVPVAEALAEMLTGSGPVAFRWDGDNPWWASQATLIPPPPRDLLRKIADRVTHRWPSGLVFTEDGDVAVQLFDHGWETQGQAVLVLAPGSQLVDPLKSELATRRDWSSFDFPAPAVALLTPAVDGSGALLTASNADALRAFLDSLSKASHRAGITIETAA